MLYCRGKCRSHISLLFHYVCVCHEEESGFTLEMSTYIMFNLFQWLQRPVLLKQCIIYRTVTEFLQIDICTIVLLVFVSAVWWAQTLILSWIPLLQWHNIWPAPREMKLHASWPISTLRRKSSLNRKTKAFVVFACICSVWLFQRKKYGKEE